MLLSILKAVLSISASLNQGAPAVDETWDVSGPRHPAAPSGWPLSRLEQRRADTMGLRPRPQGPGRGCGWPWATLGTGNGKGKLALSCSTASLGPRRLLPGLCPMLTWPALCLSAWVGGGRTISGCLSVTAFTRPLSTSPGQASFPPRAPRNPFFKLKDASAEPGDCGYGLGREVSEGGRDHQG